MHIVEGTQPHRLLGSKWFEHSEKENDFTPPLHELRGVRGHPERALPTWYHFLVNKQIEFFFGLFYSPQKSSVRLLVATGDRFFAYHKVSLIAGSSSGVWRVGGLCNIHYGVVGLCSTTWGLGAHMFLYPPPKVIVTTTKKQKIPTMDT